MKTRCFRPNITSLFGTFAVAVALYFFPSGAARAAYLRILDSSPDDSQLTFQATDFEEGFVLNNNLIQLGLGTAEVTLADAAGVASFQASWLSDNFPSGERTLYVLQQPDGLVGAILHYSWFSEDGVGTLIGTFESDSSVQPDLGPLPSDAYETDVFVAQHITIPFSQPSLDAALVTEPVPEPGTISTLVLGAGILGAGGMRHRRDAAGQGFAD